MALGKLPVPGRPTVWMIAGQGPLLCLQLVRMGFFSTFYSHLAFLFSISLSLDFGWSVVLGLRVHHNQQWVGYVEKCRL